MPHAIPTATRVLALRILVALLGAAILLSVVASTASADVPSGVAPTSLTSFHWDYEKADGIFRSDGSSPLNESGRYEPEIGDRHEVEYREGWRLTFFNVGEQGGEEYAEARLDFVREFLSPGTTVVTIEPPNASTPPGYSWGELKVEPADTTIEMYDQPAFALSFSGGPDGTFAQVGGSRLPSGNVRGTLSQGADGLFYISVRPLYIRMRVDDPQAFAGWPGVEAPGPRDGDEETVEARVEAFTGSVEFEYPDGARAGLDTWFAEADSLPTGTIIRTESDGYLALGYADGSVLELAPYSRVTLVGPSVEDAVLDRGRALTTYPTQAIDTAYEIRVGDVILSTDGSSTAWESRQSTGASSTVLAADDAILDEWAALRADAVPVRDPRTFAVLVLSGLLCASLVGGVWLVWRRRRRRAAVTQSA